MKIAKMFGLAAMVAMLAMAFFSASSASANVKKVVFCKADQTLCSSANLWGTDLTIKAHSSKAVLLGPLPVTCESDVTVLTGKETSSDIEGAVTSLTWSKCEGCSKVTTTTLPKLLILPGANPLVGTLDIVSNAVVLLEGCTFFNLHCTATVSGGSLALAGGAIGSAATVSANEVPVALSGAGCGSAGKWDAGSTGSSAYVVNNVSGSSSGSIFLSKESHL
jgi:hypothetical protein